MSAPPPLYRHALESVFAFLSLPDLSRVLLVSRDWLNAVDSMRGIDDVIFTSHSASAVCASRLARHVASWESAWEVSVRVSRDEVALIALKMRSLHTLECTLTEPISDAAMIVFPPKLQHLALTLDTQPSAADFNALLQSISTQLPLLQSLSFTLPSADALINFAPLRSLPHLTEFDFKRADVGTVNSVPTDAQIDQIRALPHLTRPPYRLSNSTLCRFLSPPHSLRWQSVAAASDSAGIAVNAELSALLPSLPSLTGLKAALWTDCHPAFLSRLTNLVRLELFLREFNDAAVLDRLASSLQSCTQIRFLSLCRSRLTADQMSAMIASMNGLHTLHLFNMPELESLRFLASGTITRTLTQLTLNGCRHAQLHLSELSHVHSLQSLTHLELLQSFVESMDAATQSLYQPPSALLPKLVFFLYSA